ncbi:RNA polymerase sigma factor [Wenzhouxiangella sp. XN79A]|uniref:RNA polymerase sigma factor n=1 Tax=Wenzhouxiangella sp. XN79A TaxID=2724193 RepID=UPI00144AE0F4|nr:RNA polymerase sigma factor [Wenzhouxiangella sp. XN79A]NKI35245.1 RNA polymerase sigma factor [Wenzhouxiangella sp. XN79A]
MRRRFEQLVDEHGPRLRQLARALLGRVDEADDVVQDTLIKLWDHLPRVEVGSELPWLLTCTRNACLDRLRGRTRARGVLLRMVGEREADTAMAEDPSEHAVAERRRRMLRDAIARLPEPARSLLILRDLQDVDVAATAATLELSENQVKVYTFRARRKLRELLEEELHEQVA